MNDEPGGWIIWGMVLLLAASIGMLMVAIGLFCEWLLSHLKQLWKTSGLRP